MTPNEGKHCTTQIQLTVTLNIIYITSHVSAHFKHLGPDIHLAVSKVLIYSKSLVVFDSLHSIDL